MRNTYGSVQHKSCPARRGLLPLICPCPEPPGLGICESGAQNSTPRRQTGRQPRCRSFPASELSEALQVRHNFRLQKSRFGSLGSNLGFGVDCGTQASRAASPCLPGVEGWFPITALSGCPNRGREDTRDASPFKRAKIDLDQIHQKRVLTTITQKLIESKVAVKSGQK